MDIEYVITSSIAYFVLDDGTCAIMTMANGTYNMFDPSSGDVMGFQNYKGAAVLLYFQAQERILAYPHMPAVQLDVIQFEVMLYKIGNDLTIQQFTTCFAKEGQNFYINILYNSSNNSSSNVMNT